MNAAQQELAGTLRRYHPAAAAALDAGGDWGPERDPDALDTHVYEDKGTWYAVQGGYEPGVRGGLPVLFWVTADESGDWTDEMVADPATDDMDAVVTRLDAERAAQERRYHAFVAETGDDPAGVYFPPVTPEVKRAVRVTLDGDRASEVLLDGVAVDVAGLRADPVAHANLKAFIDLQPDGTLHPRTRDAIRELGADSIEVAWTYRPAPSDAEVRAHYRAAAQRVLARA